MTIINTRSGHKLNIENPNPDDILLEDIAHALTFICRGAGQTNFFFPVARHCVYCAEEAEKRGYTNEVVLACLLHDASEAFMVDVPRPIKRNLIPQYIDYEDRLLACIYRKFIGRDLTDAELEMVRDVDDTVLQYDLKYLLNLDVELPAVHIGMQYEFEEFEITRNRYLDKAKQLLAKL